MHFCSLITDYDLEIFFYFPNKFNIYIILN
jgi:hypothetical protein